MRFALIGNHPDGLAFAHALIRTERSELTHVLDTEPPDFAPEARQHTDLEELLAEPDLELVIVAGTPSVRGEQLLRAARSERDVCCVHPSDQRADIAYEAALIKDETKRRLIPLMPNRLHPAIRRLRNLIDHQLGDLRLVMLERWTTEATSSPVDWDTLRHLGGEIAEISGMAPTEEVEPTQPLLVAGRFEKAGLIQLAFQPAAPNDLLRIVLHGQRGIAELDGPHAHGQAMLRWRIDTAEWIVEPFDAVDCWSLLAEATASDTDCPRWEDEIRALELAEALRRSVEKRRTSGLEYQEINEEIGNKGTLTLIGCGMIWLILLVFGISIWIPWVRWLIVPMLLGYLGLLAISWLARRP